MEVKKKIRKTFSEIRMNPRELHRLSMTDNTITDRSSPDRYDAVEAPRDIEGDKDKLGSAANLMQAIYGLLRKLDAGRKRKLDCDFTMQGCGYGDTDKFYLPTDQAKAFFELYRSLSEYSDRVYAKGLNKGKNLLMGLNTGEITVDDFNNNKLRKRD